MSRAGGAGYGPGVPQGAPFPLGARGPFQLLGVLGKGGMGIVYRAWDPGAEREVALKLILGADPRRHARFVREGQLTAALSHPNVLRVHSAGVLEGLPYLVYELVAGARTLEEVLPEAPLRRRLELLRDAAHGLGYAHACGVVHRDVKPENVLVDEGGRALVADFGLAASAGVERLTRTGAMLGTPLYMAPEAFRGEAGAPADAWALGVILYQCLTDELPFEGGSLVELAAQIDRQRPDPLEVRADLPPPLVAICRRALERDPAYRYPDAEAFAADLSAFLDGRQPSASSTSGAPRAALRRVPWGLILPVLAALSLLGWALAEVLSSDPAARPTPSLIASRPSPPARPSPSASASAPRGDLRDEPLRLTRTLLHNEAVQGRSGKAGAIYLADGSLLTFGQDGSLALWGGQGDAPRDRIMVVPNQRIRRALEGPRGELYAVAARSGLWKLSGGEHVHLVPKLPDVHWLELSAGGVIYAATEGGGVVRYDLRAGRVLEPWGSPEQAYYGVAAREGRVYVLGGQSGFLEVYDEAPETSAPRERIALKAVPRSLALAPGGGWIAIGTYTGEIRRLDLASEDYLPPFAATDVRRAHESVAARYGLAHRSSVRGLTFAADGPLISLSMADQRELNELRIWDPVSQRERRPVFRPHVRLGTSLAVSPDGREVALGSKEGVVLILRRR